MSTTVANFGIAGVGDRIESVVNELFLSQSAQQAGFSVHERDWAGWPGAEH